MRNILALLLLVVFFVFCPVAHGDAQSTADELFALVDLTRPELAGVQTSYGAGQYTAALDEYRDVVIDRLAILPMGEMPTGNSGADNLLANTVTISNLAGGYETQNIGAPGSVDWFLVTSFEHWTYYLSNMGWTSPLVERFIADPAANGAYLEKWAAFWVDLAENNYDQWDAIRGTAAEDQYGGLFNNIWLHHLVLGDRIKYLLAQLAAAAQADATLCKAAITGEHLAIILTEMASRNMPRLNDGLHGGVPNQVMSSAMALLRAGVGLETFDDASTWQGTGEFELQDYLNGYYMADGTDMEQSFNYNGTLITVGQDVVELYGALGPPPSWVADLEQAMLYRYRFLAALVRPNGMLPGLDLQSDADAYNRLTGYQSYFLDPLGAQIIDWTWGIPPAGPAPVFTSIAYPYGGYYVIRDGWDSDAHHLFMKASRMGKGHMDQSSNQIQITAFGRTMLIDSGGSLYVTDQRNDYFRESFAHNTIVVDGQSQRMGGQHYPAYSTPTDNRWHSSSAFDFCEGKFGAGYDGGYGPDDITITDVTHRREVIFLREYGLYVVTDRLDSPGSHTYTMVWNLDADFDKYDVSVSGNGFTTNQQYQPNVAVHSFTPDTLSYTRYHGFNNGIDVYGWYHEGSGYVAAPDVHRSWTGSGDQAVATLIVPMERDNDGLAMLADDSSSGVRGFYALTDDGATIQYRAGVATGALTLQNVTVTADSLLLVVDGEGATRGLTLGCTALSIDGNPQTITTADFEFAVIGGALAEVTSMAVPATFYWMGTGNNVQPAYVEEDKVLTVTVTPSYVDTVTPTAGAHSYVPGTEAVLQAGDYQVCPAVEAFSHWELEGQFYSSNPQITLLMDQDRSVTAVFTDVRACGDACHPRPASDLTGDCIVDEADLAALAQQWLTTTLTD